jgi:S1-C subfamily serine protease
MSQQPVDLPASSRWRGRVSGGRSLSILFLAMLSLTASAREFSTSEIYQSAKAAVVKLTVLGQHNEPLKTGTGFFVSPDGMLVTNRHVVEDGYSMVCCCTRRAGSRDPTPLRLG